MKEHKQGEEIKRKKSDANWIDWLFIGLGLAAVIGAVVTFSKRQNFVYFCFAIILCGFILLYRKISKGKKILIKNIGLFFVTMAAIYWSIAFFVTSFPVEGRRNPKEEKFLQETEGFSKISIPFQDGKLEGWLYSQSKELEAPLFIFLCGAGESSAASMSGFYKEGNLIDYLPNYDFLCFDYPGYGNSDGVVYESAMKDMALRIYDEAVTLDGIDETRITVAGYSIGTGPASYLAKERDIASLILIAPYDKYYHIQDPDRSDLNQLICGYNLHPYYYAKKIDEPVLMLTSDADNTCTYKGAKRVADRLKNCETTILSGVKHENMLCDESFAAISEFLE